MRGILLTSRVTASFSRWNLSQGVTQLCNKYLRCLIHASFLDILIVRRHWRGCGTEVKFWSVLGLYKGEINRDRSINNILRKGVWIWNLPVELEGKWLRQFGHVHVKVMDRQRIPLRVSECKMKEACGTTKNKIVQPGNATSWEDRRDWRLLVHRPVWNGKNALWRRWLNRRRKRYWWHCQWMDGIINPCPCYVEALCTKTDMIWNVCFLLWCKLHLNTAHFLSMNASNAQHWMQENIVLFIPYAKLMMKKLFHV